MPGTKRESFNFDEVDWVTSDLHFSHSNIIKYCNRPFSNVEEMDEALARNWNEVVGKNDTVLVLGDLALGERDYSIPFTKQLNGRKLLVPGNHDGNSPSYKLRKDPNGAKKAAFAFENELLLKQAGWTVLTEILEGYRRGIKLVASHYPYNDDRYPHSCPVNEGLPLIHGHTHHPELREYDRFYHVGVDAHEFYPVSMNLVDAWLAGLQENI